MRTQNADSALLRGYQESAFSGLNRGLCGKTAKNTSRFRPKEDIHLEYEPKKEDQSGNPAPPGSSSEFYKSCSTQTELRYDEISPLFLGRT